MKVPTTVGTFMALYRKKGNGAFSSDVDDNIHILLYCCIENKAYNKLPKRSKMKKLVLYGGLIVVAIVGIMAYNYALNTPVGSSDMPATPTPAPWQPLSLHIPSLHIDTAIINVGATSGGVMDAPT